MREKINLKNLPGWYSPVQSQQWKHGQPNTYDQSNNSHLSDKTENVQYNTALVITCVIKGTSKREIVSGVKIWIFER